MTDFVFVHGGWHGGWCWDDVRERLEAQGHRVFAPSLSGLAENAHLIDEVTGPDTHVDDVVGLIEREDLSDVTLVGHSYGGMVIAGAAGRAAERIAHLVYLDAFVPERSGQSTADYAPPHRAAEIAKHVLPSGHVAPNGFERWVADPVLQQALRARCTPHPGPCFREGVTLTGRERSIGRKTYILCARHDPSPFRQFAARLSGAPDWRVIELDCLHDAMIEAPDVLVAAIL